MGKEIRAITYRLYPNKGQEMKFNLFLDVTRNVYNRLVEICRLYVEKQLPFPTEFDLRNMTTKIRNRNEWMKGAHSTCCHAAAARVHNAFEAWMKRHKEGVGFPRFKSWKCMTLSLIQQIFIFHSLEKTEKKIRENVFV